MFLKWIINTSILKKARNERNIKILIAIHCCIWSFRDQSTMNINNYYSFVEIHLEVNHPFSLLEIINENYCEMGEWMDRKIWFGNQCENQFGGFYDGLRLFKITIFKFKLTEIDFSFTKISMISSERLVKQKLYLFMSSTINPHISKAFLNLLKTSKTKWHFLYN